MTERISLEHPLVLLLALLFLLGWKYLRPVPTAYYMPHFSHYLPRVSAGGYLRSVLKALTVSLALVALSTPVLNREMEIIKEESIDIVLSLDTSGSMSTIGFNEQDYEQNRWDVVSEVVKAFIASRKNDRIGLVVFGTTTAVASPLSHDNEVQMKIMEQVSIGAVGKSTALIDSLVTSLSLLQKSRSKTKVIILLSDGEDTASKAPLSVVLKLAKEYQVKIYTVSIGERNNDMFELIARENGGESFDATDKKALSGIYEKIDSLERSRVEHTKVKVVEPVYFYFLAASLIFGSLLLVRKSGDF